MPSSRWLEMNFARPMFSIMAEGSEVNVSMIFLEPTT
jgi:hypothetical protein